MNPHIWLILWTATAAPVPVGETAMPTPLIPHVIAGPMLGNACTTLKEKWQQELDAQFAVQHKGFPSMMSCHYSLTRPSKPWPM